MMNESASRARLAAAPPPLLTRLDWALSDFAARLSQLRGWKRRGAAFLAGALTALAFAPFYALPLMAAGYTILVLLLDGVGAHQRLRRAAFSIGWFFGLGFHLLGVYWMAFSFFVQAEEFAWMSPFVVLGMPAFLALFSGVAAMLAVTLWRSGWRRILIFAVVWMVLEYARGHILTGLPWNLPGQALAGTAIGAQTAAWIGVYGLSLVAVLIAAAPAAFAGEGRISRGLFVTLAGTGALFAVGALRLVATPDAGVHEGVFVRIVQPNIPQREKIDPDLFGRNFSRHLALSRGATPGALYVLWPENAAPLLDEAPEALEALSRALSENATLITGTVRRDAGDRYYNSVAVVPQTALGRVIVDQYDKHHLVPFGEYLPFSGFLRAVGLAQLAPYDDGFSRGAAPKVMSADGPAFSPLICYEAIFPGEIYPKGERPDWLVAVTNDAWFGDTSGPRQHLDQARLRSIETGLPMARSANTGISALIDAKGRLLKRIRLYTEGVIDAPLPRALSPTLYSRIGDVTYLILSLVALSLGVAGRSSARVGR
jgi:apolipoprotein N-acyltransferase